MALCNSCRLFHVCKAKPRDECHIYRPGEALTLEQMCGVYVGRLREEFGAASVALEDAGSLVEKSDSYEDSV